MTTRATSAPVTASLTALLLVLAACGRSGSPESSPSADPTPPTTPAATEPGSDGPSPEPSATSPTPVPTLVFTDQRFEGNPVAILADPNGWVAVGVSEAGAPAAWTSSDAETWTPRAVPDPNPELRETEGFVGSVMGPMAKWGDTWFSFGTVIGCCDGRGVLAWRSTDGQAWEVIESQSPLFTDGYFVQQLLAHDDGLVAREVGFAFPSSRVWSWTPEESWVASDLGGTDEGSARAHLTGLAWDGERLVAVGAPFRGHDAPPSGGVWVSNDGKHWEAIDVPAMLTAELSSVAAVPGGGFLAIGQQDGVPAAWGSADGRAWAARSLPEDAGLAPSHVFEAGDVLLALGFGDDRTAAWISGDGITWGAPGAMPPLDETGVVAGNADQIVIIGRERTSDGSGSSVLFRASLGD